jgi:DNA-binding PadR family transcriptional regulator
MRKKKMKPDLETDIQATFNLAKALATYRTFGEQTGAENAYLRRAFFSADTTRPHQLSYQDQKKLEKAQDIEATGKPVRGRFGKETRHYRITDKGVKEMENAFKKLMPRLVSRSTEDFFDALRIARIFFFEDDVLDLIEHRIEVLKEGVGERPNKLSDKKILLEMYVDKRKVSPFICSKLGIDSESEECAMAFSKSAAPDILFPEDIARCYDQFNEIREELVRSVEKNLLMQLKDEIEKKQKSAKEHASSKNQGSGYNE